MAFYFNGIDGCNVHPVRKLAPILKFPGKQNR